MKQINPISVIDKDGFVAVYVGYNFFKEITICNYKELMFILTNITTKKEKLLVVKEIIYRLDRNKEKASCARLLGELERLVLNDRVFNNTSGENIAKTIILESSSNKDIKKAITKPTAIQHTNLGIDESLFNAPLAYAKEVREEFEIEVIIKKRKIELINEEYFSEYHTPIIPEREIDKSEEVLTLRKKIANFIKRKY